MKCMKVIACDDSKELFELSVENYINDKKLISINCQRNLFYKRQDMAFMDVLKETYTAFIVYKEKWWRFWR